MTDWAAVRADYVMGDMSLSALAEKHGVPVSSVRKKSAAECWKEQREQHRNKIGILVEQKAAEKISDVQAEIAAISSRLHLKIMQHLEKQTDMMMQQDKLNTYDLRRITQSYKDMQDIDLETAGSEEQHNALMDAIRKAAGADGD